MKVKEHELYPTCTEMRRRCNNPNHHDYKYYGGRGIKVCKRWDIADRSESRLFKLPKGYGRKTRGTTS